MENKNNSQKFGKETCLISATLKTDTELKWKGGWNMPSSSVDNKSGGPRVYLNGAPPIILTEFHLRFLKKKPEFCFFSEKQKAVRKKSTINVSILYVWWSP
jgi:hypothetical protein